MIKEFGETIKNARLAKDLSLRDLAELTGLDLGVKRSQVQILSLRP
jgi:transcriptional regulator with XRE-family HTH domain